MLYEPELDPTLATRPGQLRDEPGQAVTNPRIRDGSTVAKASPAPCPRRQTNERITSAYSGERIATPGALEDGHERALSA
jgi:hypothetical protein